MRRSLLTGCLLGMAFAGLGGGLWLGLGAAQNESHRRENADLLEISQTHGSSLRSIEAELRVLLEQVKLWPDLSDEALARAFQTSRAEAWLEVDLSGVVQKSLIRAQVEKLAPTLVRARAGAVENPAQPRQPYLLVRQQRSPKLETVLLLDPQRFFGLFQLSQPAGRRFALFDPRGRVLAHTQRNLIGADLSSSELGARIRRESGGVSKLPTLEGLPSTVAWNSLEGTEALFATERVVDSARSTPWAEHFGKGLLILGSLSFLGLIFSRFANRTSEGLPSLPLKTEEVQFLNPALESLYTSRAAIEAHRERTQSHRPNLQPPAPPALKPRVIPKSTKQEPKMRKLTANDLVARFEHQSRQLFEQTADLRLVQSLLCETSSQLCASPVLYFRFEPQSRTLCLETDAGFASGRAPAAAVFPLSLAALESISANAAQGARISLADYAPLQKLLLDRMGVACFEAWGFMAGPRLLGVLVILQTNSQTEMYREHLFRMMGTILRLGSTPRQVRLPQAAFHAVHRSPHV